MRGDYDFSQQSQTKYVVRKQQLDGGQNIKVSMLNLK